MERLIFPVTKKEAEKRGIPYSSAENKNAVFPSQLRKLREDKGVSQLTLAAELGISKSTLGLYETGDTLPDAKTLHDMAVYFNVSADYLLGLSSEKTSDVDVQALWEKTGLSEKSFQFLVTMHSRLGGIPPERIEEFEEVKNEIAYDADEAEIRYQEWGREFDKNRYIKNRESEEADHIIEEELFFANLITSALNALIENESQLSILSDLALFLGCTAEKEGETVGISVYNKDKRGYYGSSFEFNKDDFAQVFLLSAQKSLFVLKNLTSTKFCISDISDINESYCDT